MGYKPRPLRQDFGVGAATELVEVQSNAQGKPPRTAFSCYNFAVGFSHVNARFRVQGSGKNIPDSRFPTFKTDLSQDSG